MRLSQERRKEWKAASVEELDLHDGEEDENTESGGQSEQPSAEDSWHDRLCGRVREW